MSIHHGKKIEPGGRYDRLLSFLRARGSEGATTWEIWEKARVASPPTVASELRAMGWDIHVEPQGRSEEGAKIWRYWLLAEPKKSPPPGELFLQPEGQNLPTTKRYDDTMKNRFEEVG